MQPNFSTKKYTEFGFQLEDKHSTPKSPKMSLGLFFEKITKNQNGYKTQVIYHLKKLYPFFIVTKLENNLQIQVKTNTSDRQNNQHTSPTLRQFSQLVNPWQIRQIFILGNIKQKLSQQIGYTTDTLKVHRLVNSSVYSYKLRIHNHNGWCLKGANNTIKFLSWTHAGNAHSIRGTKKERNNCKSSPKKNYYCAPSVCNFPNVLFVQGRKIQLLTLQLALGLFSTFFLSKVA
eukprot:TRINITY_DN5311_c0_g1_i7.p2 TRINITY_DN5311_c0_g1~~TRINITY_DN5311_c0_g1_i7.p2  ORF type:complete len:232 (+),score=-8.67 TRINITY_DN5311_c0_g1_i7:1000-1695(+)